MEASSKWGRPAVGRTIQDPEQWHKRARDMRAIANGMTVLPTARTSLLRIAEEYERVALRDERRNRKSA